jgi:hypothetical protein
VSCDDIPHDGEPDSTPRCARRRLRPGERPPDSVPFAGWHAAALVTHCNYRFSGSPRNFDCYRLRRGPVFDGIVEKIHYDVTQTFRRHHHERIVMDIELDRRLPRCRKGPELIDDVLDLVT